MIQLENIHKSFHDKEVLRGITLEIKTGETMVIVGGSGTGKSVTLKHMVGLLRADEGRVLVGGADVGEARGKALEDIRARFGMLFQSGALLAWMTVSQNIALPLYEKTKLGDREIADKVKKVMAQLHLEGSEGKRPAEISGGMRKRVALARAIITGPEYLLYDEPTSGLDPIMSRNVDRLIQDTQKELGVTSVVVTHEGRVALIATPKEFVHSDNQVVKDFINAQFAKGKIEELSL
jgi:phospholipid/cholesterol/gamma-HCH transport system ATP-binding protein